ncbi:N-acyl-D-amino-acid deacylase family protein [Nocardia suismassiliense]|uniref:N-acyl-D-amino-acid deacylase family protein n=1 Tax=Nocardia suismassiliense TaxID=2077092 RepID=UPI0018FEC8C4|nr:amidohydrolase family protein [Nocardia suismassiliense]
MRSSLDLLVRGGVVIDGTGGARYRADIGVVAGRIREIGVLHGVRAEIEVDATDRYVLPGFIDAHVHADGAVWDPAVQLAMLRQGVTTLALGQDGLSFAPATTEALSWVSRYFHAVNGLLGTGPIGTLERTKQPAGRSAIFGVAELLGRYRGTTALNTVYLVPHGTIRYSVMGGVPGAPDSGQLAAMIRMAEEGLDHGAVGISSGLGYLPGKYATSAELAAVCRPAARRGLPYVTHMRSYGDAAGSGVSEACAIGRLAGAPIHISHYHGPSPLLIGLIDAALKTDLDISFDTYPYLRGCSILAKVLPDWLATPDLDRTLDALGDRNVRKRLAEETEPAVWRQLTLAYVPGDLFGWAVGMRLCDAALQACLTPADLCAELLIDTALGAGVVFDFTDDESSISELLCHDVHMGGSDGIYLGGRPHPRGYGAFARLLRRHVRDLGDWTWEQAAVHLAARPAQRFRLADRGAITRGRMADLTIIDPIAVTDHATYAHPRLLATGIDDVIIAGTPVLASGHLTGRLPGAPLRPC